jgi:hypothetical protein
LPFLKSFRGEKIKCSRCHKELGFSKNDPAESWGFDGKLCDDCYNYINRGIAIYNVEYVEGHSELTTRVDGILYIYLFDHQNKIIFKTKNGDYRTEITTDDLIDWQTVVLEEKSTAKQILTAGFSNSISKEYLKIVFKDALTDKTETLILDVDYPLDTVLRNLEPILVTAANKRKETSKILDESVTINCRKCDFKNSATSHFCSSCGESLQSTEEASKLISPYQGRDYVLYKGEKSQEEISAEKLAKRLRKSDFEFGVKYLGGHKGFPTKKPRDAHIGIFIDRIEVKTDKFNAVIPYLQMTNIENMDERRITTKRWFLVGMWAIAWKKKYVYTVIEYEDENDTQGLIFDFGKHLESKQGEIYQRMVNAKNKSPDKFGKFYQ